MELHGHTKITLTDRNGHETIHEEDNVITNLPQNIFSHNFNGRLDYSELYPLTKLFNGCLLYGTEKDVATADDTLLPSDAQVVAHAGSVAYSGIDDTCGQPVYTEGQTGPTSNGYKFVFSWPESAGNGEIKAVSLCHGDMGLTARVPQGDGQTGIKFKKLATIFSVKNMDNPLYRCQFFDWEHNKAYWVNNYNKSSFAFEPGIYEYDINLKSVGLEEDLIDLKFVRILSTDVFKTDDTSNTRRYSSYQIVGNYLYESYIYGSYVNVKKFSLTDGSYTEQSFGPIVEPDVPTMSLLSDFRPDKQSARDTVHIAAFPIIGNYIYVPNQNDRQYIKIDLTTGAWGAGTQVADGFIFRDGQNYGGIVLHNGVYIGYNHIMIGENVYPIEPLGHWDINTLFCGGAEFGETGVVYIRSYSGSTGALQTLETGIVMDSISTFNLLSQPVTKTPDQAMRLDYYLEYV